jgi:predicted nucleic acid-binding protein
LDLNVILDVILDRRPGAEAASALWATIEGGHGRAVIPAHGLTRSSTCSRRRAAPRSPGTASND